MLLLRETGQSVQRISSCMWIYIYLNKNSFSKRKCKSPHYTGSWVTTECPYLQEGPQKPWDLASIFEGLTNVFCHIHSVLICEQVITCTNNLHEICCPFILKWGIIHANSQGACGFNCHLLLHSRQNYIIVIIGSWRTEV